MKTSLIIPFHNQSKNLDKILDGIEKQSLLPDLIYLVLDRPSQEDKDIFENLSSKSILKDKIKIIIVETVPKNIGRLPELTSDEEPYLTGYVRNVGIDRALEDGSECFIFIDGDCIPQKSLIQSHINKLSLNLSVLTIGRRRESVYGWKDKREVDPSFFNMNLFRSSGVIINNPILLEKSLIIWSCNIGMNLRAIQLLRKFNSKYYDRDEVFCSEFLGKWGGEDGFLGIQAYYCKVFMSTIGEIASGIEHIDHPRPDDKYNISHITYFKEQCDKLRKKVTMNPMTLDFFSI